MNEHYAEWLAKKMNFFKSFYLQIDCEAVAVIFPMEKQRQFEGTSDDFLTLVGNMYGDDAGGNALVVNLPKLSLHSDLGELLASILDLSTVLVNKNKIVQKSKG